MATAAVAAAAAVVAVAAVAAPWSFETGEAWTGVEVLGFRADRGPPPQGTTTPPEAVAAYPRGFDASRRRCLDHARARGFPSEGVHMHMKPLTRKRHLLRALWRWMIRPVGYNTRLLGRGEGTGGRPEAEAVKWSAFFGTVDGSFCSPTGRRRWDRPRALHLSAIAVRTAHRERAEAYRTYRTDHPAHACHTVRTRICLLYTSPSPRD